jgi:hypothetical protein
MVLVRPDTIIGEDLSLIRQPQCRIYAAIIDIAKDFNTRTD